MRYLLAHDMGTSGNKATLFTVTGELVNSIVFSYDTKWYNDVWAEQDADVWYEAVCESTKEILKGINPEDVVGISFSGQMMGCLCVDENGTPLHNSIIWADMRATDEELYMKQQISGERFYSITGHRASASYGLAKLLWIKKHHPEIYSKTYKVLNAKDYIILKLTGQFVTDYSDASSTNLLDINTLEWSMEIADAVGVDLDKMPVLKKSTDIVGKVSKQAAEETGLCQDMPVVCGGGDGSMSAVGAKSIAPGDAFCTIGTSAWNAITSEKPIYDSQMRTFNWVHVVPGMYVPCGTMQAAGASISWLKNQIAQIEDMECSRNNRNTYDRINEIVETARPGSGGLLYMPYLMGERSPMWNPDARGCFIGLKMETTRNELFRSVYEGVALNLEIILKIVMADYPIKEIVMTGGGAKSRIWCQIFADIYNVDILIPNFIEEATSIGAAVTAGVGLGIFEGFDKINDFIEISDVIRPGGQKY